MTQPCRNLLLNGLTRAMLSALVTSQLCACTRQVSTADGDEVAERAPAPFSLVEDTQWPEPYLADPLWLRAREGDDIDRARLAGRENALALLSALSHGGSLGRTALAALQFATDRRGVRSELCGLAARAEAPTLGLLTAALLEALTNAPRSEETLDARADAACARVLAEIELRPSASREDKDRAVGASRQLGLR